MYIIGISCFYHDSAVCLLRDGEIIFAAQEERFSRKKHDFAFPEKALSRCLKYAGIRISDIEYVVFYEKPFVKFERILETYLKYAPFGIRSFLMALPLWLKEKLWMSVFIEKQLKTFDNPLSPLETSPCPPFIRGNYRGKILFPEHHESHAASAFFPSPFESAAFITADGVGEWPTTSFGTGKGNKIQIRKKLDFPHSLGLLYSAFTYYTGFKVNSGEYKVMGLAPYGEPKYQDIIFRELLDLKEDGSFKLNMKYFNYCSGLTMTNEKFDGLFGGPPRKPETALSQKEMDLAASIQKVTEDIMLRMARHVRKETGEKNLCLGGGVALNCVANGKILREKIFDNIWVQPASGDAGGALGAALFCWYQYLDNGRKPAMPDMQKGSYLGTEYSSAEIEKFLKDNKIPYTKYQDEELYAAVAEELDKGKVLGWFSGRMEYGPRALGSRSIIGDPRNRDMQKNMNLKIKFREGFRPFAPSVLKEKAQEWFEIDVESPYMLLTADVKKEKRLDEFQIQHVSRERQPPDPLDKGGIKYEFTGETQPRGIDLLNVPRSEIPAVTHIDYSARLQTVDRETHPRYYRLIEGFYKKTGCPVIVNTSFNVRGEPIVESPLDAYKCFMRTGLDFLVLENCILDKNSQPAFSDCFDWKKEYELD